MNDKPRFNYRTLSSCLSLNHDLKTGIIEICFDTGALADTPQSIYLDYKAQIKLIEYFESLVKQK